MQMLAFLVPIALLVAGCSRPLESAASSSGETAKARMERVVQEAIRRSNDPAEKALLETSKVFVNIKDFEIEVVGVSIVINAKGNRAFIAFTRDLFESSAMAELAENTLKRLRGARAAEKTKPGV
jgi:hypothetical protein